MRYFFLVIGVLIVLSCSKRKTHYEGYVYSNNMPLKSVHITEGYDAPLSTKTDSMGYFKLKKKSQTSGNLLIFEKNGYKKDSVELVGGYNSGRIYILFLRDVSDTLFMKRNK